MLHQLGMLADGLRDRAEDDAGLRQLLLEGRDDGHAVEHGVDGDARAVLHAGQDLALPQRDAELLVGAQQLRIDVGEALGPLGRFRRGVVIEVLEVDLRIVHVGPGRLGHGLPAPEGLEPPLQHPGRLALLRRDEAHGVLVEALGRLHALDRRSRSRTCTGRRRSCGPDRSSVELLPSRSDPLSFFVLLTRPRARGVPRRCGSRRRGSARCRAPSSRGPRLMRMARAGDVGREPHRRQHVAGADLARRARGARADGDAREIERDDQRLGAGCRAARCTSCWGGARRSRADDDGLRRDRADLRLQPVAQRAHALRFAARSRRAASAAAPKPAMAATFSVPARRRRSWPPPVMKRRQARRRRE